MNIQPLIEAIEKAARSSGLSVDISSHWGQADRCILAVTVEERPAPLGIHVAETIVARDRVAGG